MTTSEKTNWVRVTKQNPCRVCGKSDWCRILRDGTPICSRIQSQIRYDDGGWIHKLTPDTKPLPLPLKQAKVKQSPLSSPERRNTVYGALLNLLSLSEVHSENLRKRGLSETEVRKLSYKTLPINRGEVVQSLVKSGLKLAGVPGFYLDNLTNEVRLAGQTGILIPVRDVRRRIIGLQIRCDDAATGGKYKWLSSAGKYLGCSSGAPVHVAQLEQPESKGLWVTEGALKADIAAIKLNRLVLAVAGVANWTGIIPIVKQLKPERVIMAFDMDKSKNEVVKTHSEALIVALLKHGFRTFEADWNPKFKGIDDLITSPEQ